MGIYNKKKEILDDTYIQDIKKKKTPFENKFKNFKNYYFKIIIVTLICITTIIYISHSIITAPKNTVFTAYFFNSFSNPENTEFEDNFIKQLDIDTSNDLACIDSVMYFDNEQVTPDITANINKTMVEMYNGKLDIIVGDSETIDYFCYGEYFHDITEVLPEDLLEQFKDNLYYAVINEEGTKVPVGIYITDSPQLRKYSYYENSEPILGFILNSKNMDNALEFLRYLYYEN